MSIAMWNTIRLHSSEFHLTDFSCSAGSFSAITPWLPNRGPGGEPVVGLGLVGGRGHPCPQPRVGEEPQQRHGPSRARPPGTPCRSGFCASSTTIGASASPKTLCIVKSHQTAQTGGRSGEPVIEQPGNARARNVPRASVNCGRWRSLLPRRPSATVGLEAFPKLIVRVRFPSSAPRILPEQRSFSRVRATAGC